MGNGGRVAVRSSNGNMARSLSSGNGEDSESIGDDGSAKDGTEARGSKESLDNANPEGGDGGDGGFVTARALMKARAAAAANAPKGSQKGGGKSLKGQSNDTSSSSPPKKMAQVWRDDGGNGKLSKGAAASLDYSNRIRPSGSSSGSLHGGGSSTNSLTEDELRVQEYQQKYLPDAGETAAWEDSDDGEGIGEDSEEDDDDEKVPEKSWFEQTAVGGFLAQVCMHRHVGLHCFFESLRYQICYYFFMLQLRFPLSAAVHVACNPLPRLINKTTTGHRQQSVERRGGAAHSRGLDATARRQKRGPRNRRRHLRFGMLCKHKKSTF